MVIRLSRIASGPGARQRRTSDRSPGTGPVYRQGRAAGNAIGMDYR